jgi:hypothetical protein
MAVQPGSSLNQISEARSSPLDSMTHLLLDLHRKFQFELHGETARSDHPISHGKLVSRHEIEEMRGRSAMLQGETISLLTAETILFNFDQLAPIDNGMDSNDHCCSMRFRDRVTSGRSDSVSDERGIVLTSSR